MGFIFRYILLGVFAAGCLSAFSASLFEPFAEEVFRRLGIDSSRWVEPVLIFLGSSYFLAALLFVAGMTLGAWLHHLATKFDKMRAIARSESEPLEIQYGNQWAQGMGDLTIKDAACALVGIHPASFELSPRAVAVANDIRQRVRDGRLLSSSSAEKTRGNGILVQRSGHHFPPQREAELNTMIDVMALKYYYAEERGDLDISWMPKS